MILKDKERVWRFLVEFDAAEAGELRMIGQLPPRYTPAPAELWLTYEEIVVYADLPVSRALRSAITTCAALARIESEKT